jgi:hypothetical protein
MGWRLNTVPFSFPLIISDATLLNTMEITL